ncbi:MAG: methyl-accepting chemotaxis protein [Francisellaceae bacterium]|nr:methyl-accepting chemotaxis protein [Francisellaceae bacterium]
MAVQIPSINHVDKVLTQENSLKLSSIRATLNEELHLYFKMLFNEVVILSQSPSVYNGAEILSADFEDMQTQIKDGKVISDMSKKHLVAFEGDFNKEYSYLNGGEKVNVEEYLNKANPAALKLQYDFLLNNPQPLLSKELYHGNNLNYKYAKEHAKIHDFFLAFKEHSFFYDLLVVDNNGVIIYSVKKEIDLGTSLKTGPFKDSNVAALYEKVSKNNADDVFFSDYEEYLPSYGLPSLFIGTPIYDPKSLKRSGVLIAQVSLKEVDKIMSFNHKWGDIGLGQTGEAYLIDEEGFIRSDLRLFHTDRAKYLNDLRESGYPEPDILSIAARGTAVGIQRIPTLSNVVNSTDGAGISTYTDYKNNQVIAVFNTVQLPIDWNIVIQIDEDEAFAPLIAINNDIWSITIAIIGAMVLAALFIGLYLGTLVSRRVLKLIKSVNEIVETKDLTKRVAISNDDELTALAKSVNQLLGALQYTHQQTIESTDEFDNLAEKIMNMAAQSKEDLNAEDKKTQELVDAGNHIEELSSKLRGLSRNFKVFAREARRTRGW